MRAVDLTDVVRAAIDTRLAAVHVSIPATVVSYSSARNTATVRPRVKRLVPTRVDGEFVSEQLPDIHDVRIAWPAGGGSYLVMGLTAGDPVELIVSDTDPSTARESGEVSEPADVRRHSLAHCWAIPGGGGLADVLPAGPRLVLGGEGDAAALASKLDLLISTIKSWITVPNDGGAALKAAVAAAFPTTATTGSARIKVDS